MVDFIVKYWLEVLFGGLLALAGFGFRIMYTQFTKIKSEFSCVKNGMQAILRNQIIGQYNKYMDKGFIPIYGMGNVEAMYKEYHALGGNGTITKLMDKLNELPTGDEEDIQ